MITAETGSRAKEFLEWFTDFEASVKDATWKKLSKSRTSSELYSINSILTTFALFRDYLTAIVVNGKIAESEVEKDGRTDN